MTTHSLPHAYESEPTFQDHLYAWMSSAPWLAISLAFHMLLLFVLSAFPWEAFHREEPPVIVTRVVQPVDELIEEPPEVLEPEPVPLEDTQIDEVVLNDSTIVEVEPNDVPSDVFAGAEDLGQDAPDLGEATNDVIGIAGGGSKFGARRLGFGGNGGGGGGQKLHIVLDDALSWLAAHQSQDGSWDTDGFHAQCGAIGSVPCDGPGRAGQDVGVTGLALLAFLGKGDTPNEGEYRTQVGKAVRWLRSVQDPDTGLIGDASTHEYLYGHAIATLALCEAYYATESPLLKPTCQKAIYFIQRARNPYGAWRYDVPPTGMNDTSVTGWMVFALKAAEDAGLEVDQGSFDGALSWIDEATDLGSGRVGYNEAGSLSSRITGVNDHFPPEKGEAMTAVGLLCRVFMGQDDPAKFPVLDRHAELLTRSLPAWDPDGFGTDMYYWYYGTYAMFQLGGKRWKAWEAKLKPAVIESQRSDGDAKGSWDPVGPWGFSGGRVYSTALMALTVEVYFRYGRVAGAR